LQLFRVKMLAHNIAPSAVGSLGFEIVPRVLSPIQVEELLSVLGAVGGPGRRGVLGVPAVAQVARSNDLLSLVGPWVSGRVRPVRAIYFDKTPDVNWAVAWHQDLTLAAKGRAEVPGFGPWTVKDGVPHVQAPAHLLEQMLSLRLHLDDCDEANGALWVLAGSHKFGRADLATIKGLSQECPERLCRVNAGGATLMRPLLLHCSRRSQVNRHRRVLHIEYAGFDLPEPLEWNEEAR
jgi:Phytanoyl-CoA dioxygenase (PhyH)